MSKLGEKKQNYIIESTSDIKLIREKLNKMFDESNSIFKGKFIGTFEDDIFTGHTNYNINIDVKGKIISEKEKVIIDIIINDCRPNYKAITNTLFIVFLCLSLLIIAANKVTDIIIYLIPIVIFGLAYLAFLVKRYVFKRFQPKLRKIAENFANDLDGKTI